MDDEFFTVEIPEICGSFLEDCQIVLREGDTFEFLKTIPSNTVTLIVSSPPYNLGKKYEIRTAIENYLKQQEIVIKELVRVLKDNGSLCWEIGNYVEDGEVFPLDIFYYNLFKKYDLKLRNRIVWRFEHGLHASKRFSGRYETILWFTKSDDYVFNLDKVRVPSKYPGKTYYKGANRGKPSGNPLGKNPSDYWPSTNVAVTNGHANIIFEFSTSPNQQFSAFDKNHVDSRSGL
jgi:adenine-specific DNA-methyltransferase